MLASFNYLNTSIWMTLDSLHGRIVTFIYWFLPSQNRFSKFAIPFTGYTRQSGYLYLDGSRQFVHLSSRLFRHHRSTFYTRLLVLIDG